MKGFVIDTSDPANWIVRILPDFGRSYTYGRKINDNGDILGFYYRPEDNTYELFLYNPWLLDTNGDPLPPLELGV